LGSLLEPLVQLQELFEQMLLLQISQMLRERWLSFE
jgi:hypothetical protein